MSTRMFVRLGAFCAVLLCSSCIEILSWSPDGRYLAMINPDESLWLWDSRSNTSTRVSEKAVFCRFVPSGELLLAMNVNDAPRGLFGPSYDPSSGFVLFKYKPASGQQDHVADINGISVGTSGDGRYWYYVKTRTDEQGTAFSQVWALDRDTNQPTMLFEDQAMEFMHAEGDSTGARLVVTGERQDGAGVLLTFDKATGERRELAAGAGETFWWPIWVDDQRFAYLAAKEDDESSNDGELGQLMIFDLSASNSRLLQNHIAGFRPSLSPDRQTILVTKSTAPENGFTAQSCQAFKVDLESGAGEAITDDVLGGGFAQYRPGTNGIAYLTPPDIDIELRMPVVLDLDKHQRTFPVCGEARRGIAIAETLLDAGRTPESIAEYELFLAAHPEDEAADFARYRIATLTMKLDAPDLDRANAVIHDIREGGLGEFALAAIWKQGDPTVTDPAGDQMRVYDTEASKAEFQFDTDATRDLTGLRVQWSKSRIYLAIDYASARDLNGAAFSDTAILLDYGSPNDGLRQISPLANWDHGAERLVLLRHWFQAERASQYAIEVLNEKGEVQSQLIASGIVNTDFPPVRVEDVINDVATGGGTLIVSLSREDLGIPHDSEIALQVCTFKGGVEEKKGLERPRETANGTAAGCDVADAFGSENTRERIDTELKTHAADATYRATIVGAAVTTRAPGP